MKKQIRIGIFETNSSSTHTLTICTKKEFDEWRDGKVVYNKWDEDFEPIPAEPTEEELEEFCPGYKDFTPDEKEDVISDWKKEMYSDLLTYDDWGEAEYLEPYQESYTTEHGDEIVVFGLYGYEG